MGMGGGQGMGHASMQGMQGGGGGPSGGGGGGRGFGGRGRGGRGGAPKADTVKVQITQVHHPVTENLIRQVFSTVENISPPLDIHVRPYMPGEEPVVAVVRFANPTDADVALKARNNCDIYTGCLHMTISFARYEREVNGGGQQHQQQQPNHQQQQMAMMGLQQQATPVPQQGAPQQMGMQGHHQQQQQAPQQMGMMGMHQFHQQMQTGGHHQQHQQQQQSRQMMPGTMGQPQYPNQQQFGQMSAPPQQSPQPQYIPQQQQVGMGGMQHMHHQHSMQGMMGYPMMPYGGHQMQQYPQGMVPGQYPPLYGYPGMMPPMMDGNMGGGGGGRGGRGRGRGRGAMNSMPGAMGGMPGFPGMPMNFNPATQVGTGGRGGAGTNPGGYTKPTAHEMETCPFLSIAMFPKTEPLIKLFHLLECWGGVVSLRRNQKNNDIIVAKMQSPADAQAICKHLNKVPVCGVDCSGRLFSTYTERNTPSNEGDATSVEVTQYDFTTFRHRQPALRCDFNASHELLLSGCAQKSESEVMNFFSERDIFPEALHKIEEEGTFRIRMESVAAAVSLLINCQWQVCDSEKSNLTFCEEIINRTPTNEGENENDNNNNYQNQNGGQQQQFNNNNASEAVAANTE